MANTPPKEESGEDEISLILLKYDKIQGKSRHSAACFLGPEFGQKKLGDIRIELVKKEAMDKRHMKSPFCTKEGAEVRDNTDFQKYIRLNDEGSEGGDDTKKRAHYLYFKSKKLLGEMDPGVKEWQQKGLDLTMTNLKDPPVAKLIDKLENAYSHDSWKASSDTMNTTYPADMTEKQWAIVLRNNDLLCGQVLITDQHGQVVGLEPTHTPAFAIKKREIPDYDLPTDVPGVDMKFRIPYYRITDSANVDVMETQDALQASMAHSGFSQTVIQGSVGGSIAGFSAAAKYGQTKKESSGSANSKFRDQKHMYISYDFPRVQLFLDKDSLELTKECKGDLDRFKNHQTKDELDRFHHKYGDLFVPQVQLGGRLYSIEDSANFGSASVAEKSAMFKAAAGASASGFGFQAEVSWSHEKSNDGKTEKSQSQLNHSITWHADGGDTLLCNNPPAWCSTVGPFYNWRIMKRMKPTPIIDLILDILSSDYQAPEFRDIFSGINDERVQFELRTHYESQDWQGDCILGMYPDEQILKNVADNHYETDKHRLPITNKSMANNIAHTTLQAIVPKDKAHYIRGEGGQTFVRMRYNTPYRLRVNWGGHIYGIRQTTHKDGYNHDGYLYGGKGELPNIQVEFHRGDEDSEKEYITSTSHVVPRFFSDNGEGKSMTESKDIIQIVPGVFIKSRMRLQEAVTFDFHGAPELEPEFYDPVEQPEKLGGSYTDPTTKTRVPNPLKSCTFMYI